jgi:trypsin-like peptidase/tetratricopeptide repeat protein
MSRSLCLLLTLLCLPFRPALAEDAAFAAATVYKLGVKLNNGHGAIGSATLVAPGRLVTSCHTTRNAVEIRVLHREGELVASSAQSDLRHDLCMLSVPALRAQGAERVASKQLAVGQGVAAFGYGNSYRLTMTEGRITALYELDNAYVVRTTAAFPRGASGGGLFDEGGRLVGILTFRASIDDQLNYAVPIEWVERLLEDGSNERTSSSLAFWEDDAPDKPIFLHAAWLEYARSWKELETVAIDWALREIDNAEAWLALGRAQVELDQGKEAVLALRRAVALEPNNTRAWYWLAFAYRSIGFDSEFVDASAQLERLDPQLAARLETSAPADVQLH